MIMLRKAPLTRVLTVGLVLSCARVGVLWFLLAREWEHQQSLALLPLVFLLYPEALPLPDDFNWTVSSAVAFSGALVCGSFLVVAIFFAAAAALTHSRSETSG